TLELSKQGGIICGTNMRIYSYYIGGSLYVGLRLIFQDGGRFYDFQTLITLLSSVVKPYKWLR
uniref:Uncharacterized protein n=1 Tax=Amphimedon queenslandica TaxID=400682 RepID=A0A1X7SHL5_AMPQE